MSPSDSEPQTDKTTHRTHDPNSSVDPASTVQTEARTESGSAADATFDADAAADSQASLAELGLRVAQLEDALLRARAEVENVRRRGEEEASKARKFAIEGFAGSLLPVKDSLEAALSTASATPEQLRDGVTATLRQLASALERSKVVEIAPPAGTRFDPHQHQAISAVPAAQDPNTVVSVLQKGYLIADRVLRPALVTVAAAS